eukprot:7377270-Prymnesium_polylepis.2
MCVCATQLEEARASAVELNVKVYGAALGACNSAGEWQRCLELLEEMKAAGARHTATAAPHFRARAHAWYGWGRWAMARVLCHGPSAVRVLRARGTRGRQNGCSAA